MHFYWQCNAVLVFNNFHIYCPMWVKLTTRNLLIVPLSVLALRKNLRREGGTFIVGANQIKFRPVP
jgi:hypothetical protein